MLKRKWAHKETKLYISQVIAMLEELKLLETVDASSLTILGDCYDLYLTAREDVVANGITFKSSKGDLKPNPSVAIQLKCVANMLNILKDFGINPRARKMMLGGDIDSLANSPLTEFLNEMKG